MKNVLIQYVRDEKGVPFGVVAATGRDQVGFSLCNPKDPWNRKLGRDIAIGRSFEKDIKQVMFDGPYPKYDRGEKWSRLVNVVQNVRERSLAYYK